MTDNNCWIWLDPEQYPERQKSRYTGTWDNSVENDTVVEFSKSFSFKKEIVRVSIGYSADALAQLWVNGRFIGTGPVLVGGDFLANDRPRTNRYLTEFICVPTGEDDYLEKRLVVDGFDGGQLDFSARVRLFPVQICEFSIGRGGFMLHATVHFADGTTEEISTDESWTAELCQSLFVPKKYDGSLENVSAGHPVKIADVWNATPSPLPLRVERRKLPITDNVLRVAPGETKTFHLEYDKIYAGYVSIIARVSGNVKVELHCIEMPSDGVGKKEEMTFCKNDEYLSTLMYSVGAMIVKVYNASDSEAVLDVAINETYLPSRVDSSTVTDKEWVNKILEVSKHTLKYCRQYIHLDSPKHCEPSACTGDYYIETMMSSFSYGDMTLADFDVVRTARILEHNNGEMFHPTYSLIWARMLLDVYMRNGRRELLEDCEKALSLLLDRFAGYVGADGIIDTPPNYMFVDWIYIDGISLHHPPKALGQSVMNMIYYDALNSASEIYAYLGKKDSSSDCKSRAIELRKRINEHLFDNEKGLYFEGQNTETPQDMLYNYMPQNVEKRYYRINANAMAAAFGVIEGDEARKVMRKVLDDPSFDDYQPYFAHFVFKAVHRTGLDGEYLMKILEKWRAPVEACDKGLAEGFIPPEPTYSFDHSHAWGGTPLYSLPMALSSLEILEPGMTHISLSPKSLGFGYARVEIPTPKGVVACEIREGDEYNITAPEGVRVDVK